jgi:hypothetical protein
VKKLISELLLAFIIGALTLLAWSMNRRIEALEARCDARCLYGDADCAARCAKAGHCPFQQ